MYKAYKYKLTPTKEQTETLVKYMGASRFVYNYALSKRKEDYESNKEKKFLTDDVTIYKSLCALRDRVYDLEDENFKDYSWLMQIPGNLINESIRNNSVSFQRFFSGISKYPRFKSRKSKQSFVVQNYVSRGIQQIKLNFSQSKIHLPLIKWIKFKKNRSFDTQITKICKVAVSKDSCGDFWVSVYVETNEPTPEKTNPLPEKTVGIDLGIKDFCILSTGEKIVNNRFLESNMSRLKKIQRCYSRKQTGSNRQEKARLKVARLHRKIHNQREDFQHKLSSRLIREFDMICVEDLSIQNMMQNHCLAGSISSVGWYSFVTKLMYKAEWNGKNVQKIPRTYASTKLCSVCGHKNSGLTLADREWICPECLTIHDRDINAAQNIKNKGLSVYLTKQSSVGTPEYRRGEGGYKLDEASIYATALNDLV